MKSRKDKRHFNFMQNSKLCATINTSKSPLRVRTIQAWTPMLLILKMFLAYRDIETRTRWCSNLDWRIAKLSKKSMRIIYITRTKLLPLWKTKLRIPKLLDPIPGFYPSNARTRNRLFSPKFSLHLNPLWLWATQVRVRLVWWSSNAPPNFTIVTVMLAEIQSSRVWFPPSSKGNFSKRSLGGTDGKRKRTFCTPGQWSLPDVQTSGLYQWKDTLQYICGLEKTS